MAINTNFAQNAEPTAIADFSLEALIIAYYFPPFGGGASTRVHNFVKYLPNYGVRPVVLTLDPQYYEDLYHDTSLLSEYLDSVTIHRSSMLLGATLKRLKSQAIRGSDSRENISARSFSLKRLIKGLMIPDEQLPWVFSAYHHAKRVIASHRIKVAVATAPPFSTHLLGALLAIRHGIPLVLDYRDLQLRDQDPAVPSFLKALGARLERFVLQAASRVVVTNSAAADKMRQDFGLAADRVVIIENGFDGESIRAMLREPDPEPPKTFRINYFGSLTKKRSPESFFEALRRFRNAHPAIAFQVGFYGYAPLDHVRLTEEFELSQHVTFHGALPKDEALDILCNQSDVLLLLQRSNEGGATAIPGKVYEYLAAGKPILALDEGLGATTQLLESLGLPHVSDYDDVEAIHRNLTDILLDYPLHRHRYQAIRPQVAGFERKAQTAKLAELIQQVVE